MHSPINQLPIAPYLQSIQQTLDSQALLVLQADPGAGKSTAVPLHLLQNLKLDGKKIVMLEPRRLAAKSIAHYLASLLGEAVGQTIGYQIRNERKVSRKTRLEIITEGVLTNRIQNDPELTDTGLVIFDEFHERSIHADLGLTLCKDIREAYNEQLKILVMSATIDCQALSVFLGDAAVIQSEGRCYPVETYYLNKPVTSSQPRDWLSELNRLVWKAASETAQDVLVFLPGQGEIKRSMAAIQERLDEQTGGRSTVLVPLYGGLKTEQQEQALLVDPDGRQKIVFATNIAETSLTIDNISAVVDSGYERVSRYDVTSGMTRLLTQRISAASAEQRQGRAGRIQAGQCYRLWTESQQQGLEPFTLEEIKATDLSDLQLALIQWGVKDYHELDWLTEPPKPHIEAAKQLLQRLALINQNLVLTDKGQQAIKLALQPRFAALIVSLQDESESVQSMACDLVAVLMDSHFYQNQSDSDLVSRLLALQAYRQNRKQALQSYPIKAALAEQALKTANKTAQFFRLQTLVQHSLAELQQQLGRLVGLAYPDRIAKRRGADNKNPSNRYLLVNGKGALIKEQDQLNASEWLAIADLDGQRNEGRIYLACAITQATIESSFGFEELENYRYDANSQKITGKKQTRLGAIVIQESPLSQPNQQQMQSCLQQAIIDSDLKLLPWKPATQAWLNRVNWLKKTNPQQTQDWPNFELPGLVATADEWLFPYMENIDSIKALQSLDIDALVKAKLDYGLLAEVDAQAPQTYVTPSGKKLKIDYQAGQLPKVSVILQEVFGELSSPKLAWGNSNLAFELLSPASRPIQVTSDLANFWQSSYFEVAKEMKGRYPKHRWPDKPLEEKAGRSIKARKT